MTTGPTGILLAAMLVRRPVLDLRCLLDADPCDLPSLAAALGGGVAVVHRAALSDEDGALHHCTVDLPATAAEPGVVVRVEVLAADGPLSHRLWQRLRSSSDVVIVQADAERWAALGEDLAALSPAARPVLVTLAPRPDAAAPAVGPTPAAVLDALRTAIRLYVERRAEHPDASNALDGPGDGRPSMDQLRAELAPPPAPVTAVVDTAETGTDLPIGMEGAVPRRRAAFLGLRPARRNRRR